MTLRVSIIVMILLDICPDAVVAQKTLDTAGLRSQLQKMRHRDQMTRTVKDSVSYQASIDSENAAELRRIVSLYGWLGRSTIGADANYTMFLVLQHADLATQCEFLPLLEQSVKAGESRAVDEAYLRDRILMRQGKKQLYGTQVVPDTVNGGWMLSPVEDELHLNQRRISIGLEPIDVYLSRFGIEYHPPQ